MKELGDNIFDLLKNEDFVLWVVNPREESSHYWMKWIAANPSRSRDVELARVFILSSQKRKPEIFPDEAYDMVLQKIVNHSRAKKSSTKSLFFNRSLKIAATIAILLASTLLFLFLSKNNDVQVADNIVKESPYGSKLTTMLPDGSIVRMNSGSNIVYPESFSEDNRTVELNGEAFFEVKHNPDKPFYVKMNGQQVRVLGTSFNIRSYDDEKTIEVAVATGKVSYNMSNGEEVILSPTQMVNHNPTDGSYTKLIVDERKIYGWKNDILSFKNNSFEEIKKELERWYGTEIIVEGKIQGTYSGEFENETLRDVMKGLSFVFRFDFEIKSKKVYVRK